MFTIVNMIFKFLWPIIKGFIGTKIEKQNHYNPDEEKLPSVEKSKTETSLKSEKPSWPTDFPEQKLGEGAVFGIRKLPGMTRHFHYGIDLMGKMSGDVKAAMSGIVTKVVKPDYANPSQWRRNKDGSWERIWPNDGRQAWNPYVIIKDALGEEHKYVHIDSRGLKAGQEVHRGDVIGTFLSPANAGWGNCQGAHLHWEWWVNGKAEDPMATFKKRSK